MATLSVVVITRNEEANLAACLDSARFADEFVVVDDGSTDATREIAARYTDKVIERRLDRFGRQKQFAIEQATGDWILALDADERVTEPLAEEIRAIVAADDPAWQGYKLRRLTWLGDVPVNYSGWYKCSHLRLFRQGTARYLDRRVHEYPVLDDPSRCGVLAAPLEHHTYASAEEFRAKTRRYSLLAAQDWYDAGRRNDWQHALWYFVIVPKTAFFREFIVDRGFLGGFTGLRIAWTSARADFLTARHLWRLTRHRPRGYRGTI